MIVRPRQDGALAPADLLDPALAAQLQALDVRSRRMLAGKLQGERRSKRRGRSVEFDDYRPYAPGDDLRHIDWNVFARMDRFFIKIFQEEEDLSVHVIIDASASMLAGTPAKLLCACRLGAALSAVALVNNNRLCLSAIGLSPDEFPLGVHRLEPMRGRTNLARALSMLAQVCARPEPTAGAGKGPDPADLFQQGLRAIAQSRAGKGVAVLVSDLLLPGQGYAPGLRYLAQSAGYDALCVQLLAPGELDPARELAGTGAGARAMLTGDVRLTDIETARHADVTVTTDVFKAYRRAAQSYVQEAERFCDARGIRHALLASDADIGAFVTARLRAQGLLG